MTAAFNQETAEAVAAKIGTGMTYAGGGVTVAFGFSPPQWQAIGIIVGIVVGLLGLAMNLYFKAREDKRQQIYWDERIKSHSGGDK